MISGPKIELYSNEHFEKVFFMVKSFITFYLIQYHQNEFHDGLFVSLYSILQMELYFPSFVRNHQISALGCLESVTNKKGVYLEKKKQLVKKISAPKIRNTSEWLLLTYP